MTPDPCEPPLELRSIAPSTRVMLPWFPAMHLLLGAAFLFQSPTRSLLPTYMVATDITGGHVRLWALLFFAVAAVQITAVMHRSRRGFIRGLVFGGWVAVFWGVTLLAAAIRSDAASFVCPIWVLGWFVAHLASAKSLAEGEL